MKVLGQLEVAQLEQISGTSTTPAARARIYADITDPLNAIPTFYNGTTWKQLAFVTTTSSSTFVSQNSGKACTVDWSTGLNQKVVLTDNAIISFSNPQSDLTHRLVVVQNNASLTIGDGAAYSYRLNMIDQGLQNQSVSYQPSRTPPLAKLDIYTWVYKANIQSGYATIPSFTSNPQTAPLSAVAGIDISPDGTMLIAGSSSTPFVSYYPLSFVGTTNNNPLGLRNYVTPTAAVAAIVGVAFAPNRNMVFYASGTSPYIQGFFLDRQTGISTAIANPGTLPAGAAQSIAISPNGLYVGVGHTTTPFLSVYPFTGAAYGTKLANPAALPAAQVTSFAWSPTGDFIAAASRTTPFIQAWAFSGNTTGGTFGAAVSNPSPLPADGPVGQLGKGIAWRPQGDYIAMAMETTPYLYVVPFNRTTAAFGTPLSVSGAGIAAACKAVQWSPCGQYLIVVGASPGLYVIDFSAFTIGTPVAFDGSNPGAQVNDVTVHPSGDYLVLGMNTAQMVVQTMPRKAKNYLRLMD